MAEELPNHLENILRENSEIFYYKEIQIMIKKHLNSSL